MRDINELIKDLDRLSKVASQGRWWIDSHGGSMVTFDDKDINTVFVTDPTAGELVRHEDTGNLSRWRNDNDATWIATASPRNITRLLEELSTRTSESNAWRRVKDGTKNLRDTHAEELRDKVSESLFHDGCHSAATHMVEFIMALVEENAEQRNRINELEGNLNA